MGLRVFISYRRGLDAHFAGRLYDALSVAFGADDIFMDVDNIAAGLDFMEVMREAVTRCDVCLAVVGKGWATVRRGRNGPRLLDPDDPVAFEIGTAIALKKSVIPVLVESATMPRASAMPEALRPFVRFNGQQVRHASFKSDVAALVRALGRLEESVHETVGGNDPLALPATSGALSLDPMDELQSILDTTRKIDALIPAVGPEEDGALTLLERRELAADFRARLRQAALSLEPSSATARHELYDEGRLALATYLNKVVPPLSAESIAARRLLFEDCILEMEAEANANAPRSRPSHGFRTSSDSPAENSDKFVAELAKIIADDASAAIRAPRRR